MSNRSHWKNWNHSFVVSLSKRGDRREFCKQEFKKIPQTFEFFDATASEQIPDELANKMDPSFFLKRMSPIDLNLGLKAKFACLKSHFLCMKKALSYLKESEDQWVGIFQDDVVFFKDPNPLLNEVNLSDKCNLLYLGGRQFFNDGYLPVSVDHYLSSQSLSRAHGLLHLSSALYSKDSLEYLIGFFISLFNNVHIKSNPYIPYADHVFLDLQVRSLQNLIPIQFYCLNPHYCYQRTGYSDISFQYVDSRITIPCGEFHRTFSYQEAQLIKESINLFWKSHKFKKHSHARLWLVAAMKKLVETDSLEQSPDNFINDLLSR